MNKKLASQQYASNQMGQKPPKVLQAIKNAFKGKGGSKNHPGAVKMECSKTGCSAYDSGGGGSNTGSRSYAVKSSSSTGGEKNVVLKKGSRAERKWQEKISKVKESAPARPMTRKEKEKASEMRPSRQDYNDNNVTKSAPKMAKKGLFRRRQVQKITV